MYSIDTKSLNLFLFFLSFISFLKCDHEFTLSFQINFQLGHPVYRYIDRQKYKNHGTHTSLFTAQFFTDHTLVEPVSFPYLLLLDYFRIFLLLLLFSSSLNGTFQDQFCVQSKSSLLLKDHTEKTSRIAVELLLLSLSLNCTLTAG